MQLWFGHNDFSMANRRGSAASGEASLLADTRCRLNPLVVRRFAPHGQWMTSAAIVAGREASGNNTLPMSRAL
jgi:hypothetical protein